MHVTSALMFREYDMNVTITVTVHVILTLMVQACSMSVTVLYACEVCMTC